MFVFKRTIETRNIESNDSWERGVVKRRCSRALIIGTRSCQEGGEGVWKIGEVKSER